MITRINTSDYNRIDSIFLYGVEFVSSYNHNYYFLYEFLKQIYVLCLFLINIVLNLILFKK